MDYYSYNMLRKTMRIKREHFIPEDDHQYLTEIRGTVYFNRIYSKLYNYRAIELPQIVRLIILLCKKYPHGSLWIGPHILRFILGEKYKSPTTTEILKNEIDSYSHISNYSPHSVNILYCSPRWAISSMEKPSEYFCNRIPPNPIVIIFSHLIYLKCLPPDIYSSTSIKYRNSSSPGLWENNKSMVKLFNEFAYRRTGWVEDLKYYQPITQEFINNILYFISIQLDEKTSQNLHDELIKQSNSCVYILCEQLRVRYAI